MFDWKMNKWQKTINYNLQIVWILQLSLSPYLGIFTMGLRFNEKREIRCILHQLRQKKQKKNQQHFYKMGKLLVSVKSNDSLKQP